MLALEKRNHGLDVLRVLACYMVIQVHAGEFYYIGAEGRILEGLDPWWVDLYNSLCRSAVPLFVMLSGFFLLPVKESIGIFFKKRFVRVVVPFIVWCALYAFYQFFRGQIDLSAALVNVLKIPVNFGVEIGHLWYVYMLIGLYLFAPVISPWLKTASKNELRFYLSIWGVTLFLPYIHLLFPAVLGECFWNQTPLLYYFSGFLGYMILAFYVKKYWMEKKSWNLPVGILLVAVGYVVTVWGFAVRLTQVDFVPELELTWGFETINVAMMTLGLFLMIKNVRFRSVNGWCCRLVTDISMLSYGIYLVHIMVLYFFFDLLDKMFVEVPLKLPLIAVCTFIASYLIVKLISLLPKSKYIIG